MKTITLNVQAVAGIVAGVVLYALVIAPLVVGVTHKAVELAVTPATTELVEVDTYTYCRINIENTLAGENGRAVQLTVQELQELHGGYAGLLNVCVKEAKNDRWADKKLLVDPRDI